MQPELESAETKSVNLEVVRDGPERPKRGRPAILTIRKFLRICHLVEQGSAITHSCEAELVTYSHFRFRVARSPRLQERLKQAELTRESFLREFHIANIVKHAPRNVLASLWWLERRYPNEFALRNVNRAEASAEQPIGNEIPAERLAEYGKLMLEFAEENKAKQAQAVELPKSSVEQSA